MPKILTALEADFVQLGLERQLSQFRYSPNLNALISLLLSPHADLQHSLKQMFLERHIDTAIGQQLDGVGDIVGMPRPFTKMNGDWYFGFTGQSKAKAFSQAPIRDLALQTHTKAVSYMPDEAYRRLIKWKIVANHSHGTVEDVIKACQALFMASKVLVQEKMDAEIHIKITRNRKNKIDAIEQDPKPWIPAAAGVKVSVELIDE